MFINWEVFLHWGWGTFGVKRNVDSCLCLSGSFPTYQSLNESQVPTQITPHLSLSEIESLGFNRKFQILLKGLWQTSTPCCLYIWSNFSDVSLKKGSITVGLHILAVCWIFSKLGTPSVGSLSIIISYLAVLK